MDTLQGLPVHQVGGAKPVLLLMAPDRPLWRRLTARDDLERTIDEGGPYGAAAEAELARLGPMR